MTMQPLSTCSNMHFRNMCHSLNGRAPDVDILGLKNLLLSEVATAEHELTKVLKKQSYAITSDSWTSAAMDSYTGVTVHWINASWEIKSCPIGCSLKTGTATSEDHMRDVETILKKFELPYENMMASVTDTDATMQKYGRLLKSKLSPVGGWVGCIAHQLELVTGIAFDKIDKNRSTMKAARSLVGLFTGSSQKTAMLLAKQGEKGVTLIQDVVTRWWSTYNMCERLLRLKSYINILIEEGDVEKSYALTDEQWTDLACTKSLLEPFMVAQIHLEAEKYITVSSIPVIIYKIRNALKEAARNYDNSGAVRSLAEVMLADFNSRWGTGESGTVYKEHTTLGPKNRAKGFPLVVMIANLLDPRTKFVSVNKKGESNDTISWMNSAEDTQLLFSKLRELLILEVKRSSSPVSSTPTVAEPAHKRQKIQQHDLKSIFDDDDVDDDDEENPTQATAADSSEEAVSAEMFQFALEQRLPRWKTKTELHDPLQWWKIHEIKFPYHAALARKLLAIPATSAPAERLFSAAGHTLSSDRSRLTPDIAEAILFTRGVWDLSR